MHIKNLSNYNSNVFYRLILLERKLWI